MPIIKRVFRPKLKICYKTNNKIWFNKNSKFIYFYNFRRRIPLKRNRFFKRFFLKSKNIKWTLTRRFMYWGALNKITYKKKKRINKSKYNIYKDSLHSKQQLKKFYGKLKEKQILKYFIKSWYSNKKWKQLNFFFSMERRLDVILYRLRFLPTIYSCNQYITYNGLCVNNTLKKRPNLKINIGDIISFPSFYHWLLFFVLHKDKLEHRLLGHRINKNRDLFKFKKTFIKLLKYLKFKKFKRFSNKIEYQFLHKRILNKIKKKNTLNFYKDSFFFSCKTYYGNINYWLIKRIKSEPLHNVKNFMVKKNFQKFNFFQKIKVNKIKKLYKFLKKKIHKKKKRGIRYLNLNKKNKAYKKKKKIYKKFLSNSFSYYNFSNIKFLQQYDLRNNFLNMYNIYNFLKNKKKNDLLLYKYLKFLYFNKLKDKKKTNQKSIFYKSKEGFLYNHFFYIPSYYEVDFYTLRFGIFQIPHKDEIFYSFNCSLTNLISFYKNRGF